MKFRDIVGGNVIGKALGRAIDSGRVSHAQLFTGRPGYGTLAVALAYAQYLNCLNRVDGDSCGVCSSCVKMDQLVHPDVHFVFPVNSPKGSGGSQKPTSDYFMAQWRETVLETNAVFDEQMWYRAIEIDNQQGIISKSEADEIIKKLSFKSFEGRYKIVVIWMPERMRAEAANSLLKILEEPWEKTVFLMVSESPQRLLPTIISRTQEVAVPRVAEEEVERFLIEKRTIDPQVAAKIARLCGGDLIEADRLCDADQEQAAEENFEYFMQLMRLSYNDKHMELLEWAENVADMGREQQKRFIDNAIRLLRNSYMLNAGMTEIAYLWGEELDFCTKFAPFVGNHNIEKLVAELELTKAQISQNGNPKMVFAHSALAISKLIVRL